MGLGRTMSTLDAKSKSKPQPEKKSISERMLSLPEAARYLDISESTMRRYIRANKIPYRKVGHKLYKLYPSDLNDFINKSTAQTP